MIRRIICVAHIFNSGYENISLFNQFPATKDAGLQIARSIRPLPFLNPVSIKLQRHFTFRQLTVRATVWHCTLVQFVIAHLQLFYRQERVSCFILYINFRLLNDYRVYTCYQIAHIVALRLQYSVGDNY